ncbi:MAG: hypothetical protein A3C44_03235 [Gammaproteobacteria bacterium RIFCSPHIGHO2_02_FULL_39_13]|nr:MAG: hypothetical protein A3C44_03235 [Gammaproteobacteria bacterium RIFCSPHIGHO2_02_FULL_39_13]OGT49853.1 MAG: hypothetical protein A3E53_02720 [Gammaproteobacteria bacterium RIFCSPHIGHO2_12_FULL_39_24]
MRKLRYLKTLSSVLLISAATATFAWNHGISIGYGGGPDLNHDHDTNSGGFLSAEFLSLVQKNYLNLTFGGSLGQYYSTSAINKHLFAAALPFSLRLYPFNTNTIHPFLLASFGPGYISERKFGENNQASNFAFQTIAGGGFEFGQEKRVDLNMRFIHYSNAYTMKPNEGFNIFYIVSLGYLF